MLKSTWKAAANLGAIFAGLGCLEAMGALAEGTMPAGAALAMLGACIFAAAKLGRAAVQMDKKKKATGGDRRPLARIRRVSRIHAVKNL